MTRSIRRSWMVNWPYERHVRLCGASGVDRHGGPGNVSCLFAQKEFNCICNVGDLRKAVQRAASENLITLSAGEAFGHVSIDKAGGNRIDRDPERPQLSRK